MKFRTYGTIFISAGIAVTGALWYQSPHRTLAGEDVASLGAAVEERYEALIGEQERIRAVYTNAVYFPSNVILSATNLYDVQATHLDRLILSSDPSMEPVNDYRSTLGDIDLRLLTTAAEPISLRSVHLDQRYVTFYIDPDQEIPSELMTLKGGYFRASKDPKGYDVLQLSVNEAAPVLRSFGSARSAWGNDFARLPIWSYSTNSPLAYYRYYEPTVSDYYIPSTNIAEKIRQVTRRMDRTARIYYTAHLPASIESQDFYGRVFTNGYTSLSDFMDIIHRTGTVSTNAGGGLESISAYETQTVRTFFEDGSLRGVTFKAEASSSRKRVEFKIDYPPQQMIDRGLVKRIRIYASFIHRASVTFSAGDRDYTTLGRFYDISELRDMLDGFGVLIGQDFDLSQSFFNPEFSLGWSGSIPVPVQKTLPLQLIADVSMPRARPDVVVEYGQPEPRYSRNRINYTDGLDEIYTGSDRISVYPYLITVVVDWSFQHLSDSPNAFAPIPYRPDWANTNINISTNGGLL